MVKIASVLLDSKPRRRQVEWFSYKIVYELLLTRDTGLGNSQEILRLNSIRIEL